MLDILKLIDLPYSWAVRFGKEPNTELTQPLQPVLFRYQVVN